MSTIKVTAGKDRLVPIPKAIATAPGAMQLYLSSGVKPRDAAEEQVVQQLEVPAGDAWTIRALDNGDLVKLEAAKTAKKES